MKAFSFGGKKPTGPAREKSEAVRVRVQARRVRVRSPFSCLASASSLSSAGGSAPASPEAEAKRLRKKLRDGHWTLAFADEATCAAARDALDAGAAVSRAACRAALAPVLEAS